ncbi:MAG TPA: protease inhibitor I42 family protein [Methanosarcina sp.]|jgi:inhibitor of cysteine peptidase
MKRGISNKFWKNTKIITVLLMAFVILSGCVDERQNKTKPENTTNLNQGTSGGDYIYSTANVKSVKIITLESFPVQIQVIAEGSLPDRCTKVDEIKTKREGNAFNINISTKRPKDAACTQAIENFTKTIPLEVQGLKAGNYTVNVNGVNGSFELAVDNETQQSPGSMPTKRQVITEADNGKTINLENGETFYLRLRENPSTGYSWQLNLSQGFRILSYEYTQDQAPKGSVGVPGTRQWEIKTVTLGSQQITGIYKRPWENVTGEENTFTLKVEVV